MKIYMDQLDKMFHPVITRKDGYELLTKMINEEGGITPKLASWHDTADYQECSLVLSSDNETVTVKADYSLSQGRSE